MISTADLKTQTKRDLADTARQIGVTGWHSMKKDELIEAIRKNQRRTRRKANRAEGASGSGKSDDVPKPARKRPVAAKQPTPKPSGAKKPADQPHESRSRRSSAITAAPNGRKTSGGKTSGGKASSGKASAAKASDTKASDTRASGTKASGTKASGTNANRDASSSGADASASRSKTQRPPTAPRIVKVLRKQQAAAESRKDLSACVLVNSQPTGKDGDAQPRKASKDRIVLIVRDSYWLQASWEIARASIERARAAMGSDWHTAEPVLRLMEVAHGASANTAEKVVRDVPIHGGVNNWYLDVDNPPGRFRVLIGYRSATGRVYSLCRSNVVQTPAPGACDPIDGHWQDIAEDYERIYSLSGNENGTGSNDLREMFEDRLQRPMIDVGSEKGGDNAPDLAFGRERDLPFVVDAELIVYGSTVPGATVTLAGEPVRLRPDGTFTVRMELPDKRQVLPVVASSRDGMRQRTTVVAVERNTKVMEAVSRHHMD